MVVSTAEFDAQYAKGEWQRLNSISELGHYSIIAGYSSFCHERPAILDVGCGQGLLQTRLAGRYAHYTGIDSSSEAIAQAECRKDERTRFLISDATTYVPERSFDQIVFNEILYYMQDPSGLLARYARYLVPNGCLIVSMYEADRPRLIWAMLEENHACADSVCVRHMPSGVQWTVKILRPSK